MTDMPEDPFASEVNEEDPFAGADEANARGGTFVPWPPIDAIEGRLIVLVPRKHDKEAEVSEFLQRTYNLPKTREEWRADLVVLDGGDLKFTYRAKVEGTDPVRFDEKEHFVAAVDLPYVTPNWRITWGNILGTLNRIHGGPKPFALGRIRAGYSVAEMRNGKTYEDFAKELAAFYAKPQGKKQPKPTWHFETDDSPAAKAPALAWWKAARAAGFSVNA
jgi:hypothetical protein